jgi:ubiquitin-protein ligase
MDKKDKDILKKQDEYEFDILPYTIGAILVLLFYLFYTNIFAIIRYSKTQIKSVNVYKMVKYTEKNIQYKYRNVKNFKGINTTKFTNIINKINKNMVKQLLGEIISHSHNLPIDFKSSIFYRYYEDNLKFHEFIITGPIGTPYDSGCFLFKMFCPSDYPNINPIVHIYTTGHGSVRFNPNLYADGKVCLSILGTWKGFESESWIPGTSTMMQIMISIQSLVLIEEPYFNEPAYNELYNNKIGKERSKEYNYEIRLNTMKWAMLDILINPPKYFENVILTHFRLKSKYIKEVCNKWINEAPITMKNEYLSVYNKLCIELEKLIN